MPTREDPEGVDIHKRKRDFERSSKALTDSRICEGDKKLILRFIRHKRLSANISLSRESKYLRYLRILGELLGKPFKEASKDDMEDLLEKVYNRPVKRGETVKKASVWTKKDIVIILRAFYTWLEKPGLVDWIKPLKIDNPVLGPDDLLSWEDVEKLSSVCMNARDEALVKVLWESGCRIGEILSLRVGDIDHQGKGVIIRLRESKTRRRKILVVRSAGILIRYRNSHPHKEDKEYPLWINLQNHQQMNYAAAAHILQRLAKRAGLHKPVNPHTFRKSSATHYARFLSPSELKARFGWKQSSKMLDIYIHPDEEGVNNKILELEGVEKPPEHKEKFRSCFRCGTLNPTTAEECTLCGEILDEEKYYRSKKVVFLVDELIKEKGGYDKVFGVQLKAEVVH